MATPEPSPDAVPTLHLYAQGAWHDEAFIVGTRDALERLRDALCVALDEATRKPHSERAASFFCTDGEGYQATILVETEEGMDHYAMPYTWEVANKGESAETNPQWPRKRGATR